MKGGRLRRLRRVRTKASKASKVRTKASKGEDERGFEGFEGEDEGGQGFEGKGDNWNVTEHATGGAAPPPTPPAPVKQQTPLLQAQRNLSLANWPARHVRTKRRKPHRNALGGLKTEKNGRKKNLTSFQAKACPHTK